MSNSIDLDRVEKDARHTVNQDGITYLFMGILLMAVGASFLFPSLSWIGILGILFIFPAEGLRRRVTYPRIGYAKFQAPPGLWRGIGVFAILAIIILAVMAFVVPQFLPLVIGVVFCLSFYFGASMSDVRLRDWIVMGLMLVSGGVTAVLFDDWHVATAVQLCFIGVILLLIGVVDLIHFIRTVPLADDYEIDQRGV